MARLRSEPLPFLQIVREAVAPGREAEYAATEAEIARICLEFAAPHPYLGAEDAGPPPEVWFFNEFASLDAQQQVGLAYAGNAPLMAALTTTSRQKAALMQPLVDVTTAYRPDLSRGRPWRLGDGRFLVVGVSGGPVLTSGTVFEGPDGTQIRITPAATRDEAQAFAASAGTGSRVVQVRPIWSTPAARWIAADPEFWSANSFLKRP